MSEQISAKDDVLDIARDLAKYGSSDDQGTAITCVLISIAEQLASIHQPLTYLAEVIELKGQSRY